MSPLGVDVETTVARIRRGETALGPLTVFPCDLGREVLVSEVTELDAGAGGRFGRMGRMAVEAALDAAGMAPDTAERRACPLFVGTISGAVLDIEQRYRNGAPPSLPLAAPPTGSAVRDLAASLGLHDTVMTINTACTSSAYALSQAMLSMLRTGAPRAVVLGVDTLNAMTLAGFASLYLLDEHGTRPFDRDRRGIHVGEAAGAVVLERCSPDERAQVELTLPLCMSEPVHPTRMAPDGTAPTRILDALLVSSGLAPSDIVAVKTHGNGTPDNDVAEGRALRRVFDSPPPATSLKGYLGHTMGAAGLVELVTYLGCLRAGFVPACAGFETRDDEIDFEPLREHRDAQDGYHVLNYFGFGGSLSLMLLRWTS